MPTNAVEPATSVPPLPTSILKTSVISTVLDFVHAMRTAPAYGAEQAIQWATLEKEFETRLKNEPT